MSEFIKAVANGDLESVEIFLKEGIDVNLQGVDEDTALLYASYYDHMDIVSLLLEAGAYIDKQTCYGDTALIIASQFGNLDTVSKLIEADADVNLQDGNGDTALIWASKNGDVKIVSLLLSAGANVSIKDNNGMTALDFPRGEFYNPSLTIIDNLDSFEKRVLDKMFDTDPYFWTRISKHHSKRAFHYFVGRYSDLLNVSRDIIQSIF